MKKIQFILLSLFLILLTTTLFAWTGKTNNTILNSRTDPTPTDSPAIKAGDLVFISGQGTGSSDTPDPTGAAIEEAFQKISVIANQMGGDLSNVVKLTVYLADLDNDYPLLNTIIPKYFSSPYPTRSTIGVTKLPRGHRVEIDAVMYLKNS